MRSKVLIIGGGSGLGLQLANMLRQDNCEVHIISRSTPSKKCIHASIIFHQINLQTLTDTQIDLLGSLMGSMDGIAFCQRYRTPLGGHLSKSEAAQNEYQVCVHSTAILIEKMQEKIMKSPRTQSNKGPIKLLLVGSTYSNYAGYDQDWSYHAVKSALHGLVRYFAIRSNGRFSINMISPPTFMKLQAEEYWMQTEKYTRWKHYPSNGLPTSQDVAELARMLLMNSNRFINGQNIICDGGASCLYLDQQGIA